MAALTVTAEGQVTLDDELLKHLGLEAGGRVEVDLLPGGRAAMRAAKPTKTIADLKGLLKGKTNGRAVTLEEIQDVIEKGWAGRL